MTQARRTILVVDDDADARMVMRAALRKAGYDVRMAEGGLDALKQFKSAPTDLVMLDVEMPDLSGHEVCAQLRAQAGTLLPIVMVTGMDDVASVETAYASGATDFISKPVNWALLGHRVHYLFRGLQTLLDLRSAESRNAAILNAIPDLLFEMDIDGRYIEYRVPDSRLLPVPANELLGRTVSDVLPASAAQTCLAALRQAHKLGSSSGAQFELPLPQGSTWFELSVSTKAVAAGCKPRFIVLARDITERKMAEVDIARLAHYDSLTGLPNRPCFLHRLERAVKLAKAQRTQLAVLFLDLDGFKGINDSMGHATGDLILQWAAERLRDGLRSSDMLSRPMPLGDEGPEREEEEGLARLGGDEFTAVLMDIEGPQEALEIADRIGAAMRTPFALPGGEVVLTSSIGIALYPQDGADASTLLKHADTAMYHAKKSGRNHAQLYRAALTTEVLKRLELDASLRLALERDEFHLVYQPQVDAKTGCVAAVEALIRWQHPTRGLVMPLEFIPLAEENGLIEAIGQWVLRTACTDAARWNLAGPALKVAVNLSPLQFGNERLPRLVADVLAQTGLSPRLLELEVTEGVLMKNDAVTRQSLQHLHGQGISIALDDFGTGFSSLAYLTRMPISHIKIDRCFVSGLLEGGESEAIVRAVLAMARSLRMLVTAEGVETEEQARRLKAMACDGLQGYWFSRPMVAQHIPALRTRRWVPPARAA